MSLSSVQWGCNWQNKAREIPHVAGATIKVLFPSLDQDRSAQHPHGAQIRSQIIETAAVITSTHSRKEEWKTVSWNCQGRQSYRLQSYRHN